MHIPYKGTGPALTDLLGGHIPMALAPIPPVHANVEAGLLRALAVTGKNRSSLMPDVPTIAEAGPERIRGFALLRPGRASRHAEADHRQTQYRLAGGACVRRGEEAIGRRRNRDHAGNPEDYADFIDKDEKKWSELVKASGVEQE